MDDMAAWDDDFRPENPFAGGKAEDLTDGEYEFKITDAKLKEARGKKLVELKLEVLTQGKHEGAAISDAIWLTDLDCAKRFGYTLKGFGFDVDNWTKENGRPFSKEFLKALRWMKGMRVKAKKVTNKVAPKYPKDVEHIYHNINWKGRSDQDDGLPRKIGKEHLDQPDPNAEDDPFAASA